jgi:rod shape-determining protein MreC
MDTLMGRYRNVTILAAAIFIQILGLAIQIKRSTENESSRLIRVWAVTAVTPLEKAIVGLQTGATGLWHNYFYLRGVRQENRQLREQIEQLQLEQVRLKQDADQAHRLQALLGFKEQYIAKTTAAQVIGSSGSEQSRTVYIDKGSRDGITPSMPVISSQGVVGKVISVFKSTSQVLLINDQQSGVGAILEQSRLQGVLKGRASGEVVIDKIMSEEEVKAGDRVLTSGGDQIFPKGLPIGSVARIVKGTEFLQVTVKPATELNHLEEVLVITQRQEHEAPISTASSVRAADILAQRLPSVPDRPVSTTPASNAPAITKTPGTTVTTPAAAPAQTKPQVGTAGVPAGSKPKPDSTTIAAKPPVAPNGTTSSPKISMGQYSQPTAQKNPATPTTTAVNPPKATGLASQEAKAENGKPPSLPGSTLNSADTAKAAGATPQAPKATAPKSSASALSKPTSSTTQIPANSPPPNPGDTPQ